MDVSEYGTSPFKEDPDDEKVGEMVNTGTDPFA